LPADLSPALCARPDADERQLELPPPPEDIKALAAAAPVMPGAEYLTADVLISLWAEIGAAFLVELAEAKVTVQEFLKSLHPAWNVVGKVHFNLAENRKDEEAPFAFLATYTHRLSAHGKAQHLPLGQALRDYAGAASKEKLLSLLAAGSARGGILCVAETDGRCRRDLSPVALVAARRLPVSR
jgi:hypothetical protein